MYIPNFSSRGWLKEIWTLLFITSIAQLFLNRFSKKWMRSGKSSFSSTCTFLYILVLVRSYKFQYSNIVALAICVYIIKFAQNCWNWQESQFPARFLKIDSKWTEPLSSQVVRFIFTFNPPPHQEKLDTSPEPQKLFNRVGFHGLQVKIHLETILFTPKHTILDHGRQNHYAFLVANLRNATL